MARAAPSSGSETASLTIELFGVPRIRAGSPSVTLSASCVGEALRELARICPTLDGSVVRDGAIHPAYRLSLNGERFVSDLATPLADGDVLLLMSADVGG
jgi:molybdopterin converting factor small subunit